jgi:hypothetical protein
MVCIRINFTYLVGFSLFFWAGAKTPAACFATELMGWPNVPNIEPETRLCETKFALVMMPHQWCCGATPRTRAATLGIPQA